MSVHVHITLCEAGVHLGTEPAVTLPAAARILELQASNFLHNRRITGV